MKQYWKVGLAAAIVLAIAGMVTGIVAAQTSGPTPDSQATEDQSTSTPDGTSTSATPKDSSDANGTKSERRDEYLDALAANLGVSREALDGALTDTALDMVDKALADGRITQDEADNIKERINSGDFPPIGPGFAFGHGFEKGFDRGFHVGVKIDDLATFLGVDISAIHEGLMSGQTLAQIAEANGKSRDELKAHITANAKERLDQAVADGDITQEEADSKLRNISEMVDNMIDNSGPFFRGGPGHHFRGGPGPFGGYDDGEDSSTPGTTQTTSLLTL